MKGKSIKIFLADGSPNGILTAEIMNWTGHVLCSPRSKIAELILRPEMKKTGVYLLTGNDTEGSGATQVYIGESDNVGARLTQHNRDSSKDFWEKTCVITSKDQNITKSHARFLESKLINIVQKSGVVKIINSTAPVYDLLPEADIADMEYFISQIQLILPVLGLDYFREKIQVSNVNDSNQNKNISNEASPIFVLTNKKQNLVAHAQEINGIFIVLKGSIAQPRWLAKRDYNPSTAKKMDQLYESNKIMLDPNTKKGYFKKTLSLLAQVQRHV